MPDVVGLFARDEVDLRSSGARRRPDLLSTLCWTLGKAADDPASADRRNPRSLSQQGCAGHPASEIQLREPGLEMILDPVVPTNTIPMVSRNLPLISRMSEN